jgi:hypothetical protein
VGGRKSGGGFCHPIFGQGVAGATPTAGMGAPMAKRVVRPPSKAPKRVVRPPSKKKKGGKEIRGWHGQVEPPHFWPRGGWSHPHGRSRGGRTTLMAKGVVRPPLKGQNPHFVCFFFFFWAFGGGQTTPLAMGVVRPPPDWL